MHFQAHNWDGREKFKGAETAEERARRDTAWEEFLEHEEEEDGKEEKEEDVGKRRKMEEEEDEEEERKEKELGDEEE